MARAVKLIRVNEGDSGRITKLEGERAQEFAALVAAGELDERKLAKAMEIGVLSVRKALRSTTIRAVIKEEIEARKLMAQAKAAQALDQVVEGAISDLRDKRGLVRAAARKELRQTAEGTKEPIVNQNNNITAWDPMQDEALWEQGRQFFADNSKQIAVEVVKEVFKKVQDD